jgi:hypothetical protein
MSDTKKRYTVIWAKVERKRKSLDWFEILTEHIRQLIDTDAFVFVIKCQREQIKPGEIERIAAAMNIILEQLPEVIDKARLNIGFGSFP